MGIVSISVTEVISPPESTGTRGIGGLDDASSRPVVVGTVDVK